MTGKKSDSSTAPRVRGAPDVREALVRELAYHEEAAARLGEQGNVDTYHHRRAEELRAELKLEVRNELD